MSDPGGFSSSSSLPFSEINAGGGLLVYIVTTDDNGTTRRNHFPVVVSATSLRSELEVVLFAPC